MISAKPKSIQSPDEDGIRVTVDWTKYDDNASNFESITHDLEYIENPAKKTGTTLIITQLHDVWEAEEFEALREDLTFLIPPLDNFKSGFDINLFIDSHPELSGTIQPLVREAAEYELLSALSAGGKVRHVLTHKTDNETVEFEKDWIDVPDSKNNLRRQAKLFNDQPECGPVQFHLLFFLRSSTDERNLDFNLTNLRKYLDVFSGIRIYRDGFQVKPYGSKKDDWLGLNSRKTKSPEGVGQTLGAYRVSNNQLVGTVSVGREANANLQDKANREGIIETSGFQDLKDFLLDAIHYLEIQRQEQERRNYRANKYEDKQLLDNFDDISERLERLFLTRPERKIPPPHGTTENFVYKIAENAVIVDKQELTEFKDQFTDLKENLEAKLEENQVLRALATVGIALSTFSHEIQSSVSSISNEITLIEPLLQQLPQQGRSKATQRLDVVLSAAQRIQDWSKYVLESVQAKHRVEQELNFRDTIDRLLYIFQPSFDFRSIKVTPEIDPAIPRFLAFPIDLEAILINLISNAVKALELGIPLDKRHISIKATYLEPQQTLNIEFKDSGAGISLHKLPFPKKGIDQVFEPFVTASGESSTGMGLAVVTKIINGLGGNIALSATSDIGGAAFIINLPLKLVPNSLSNNLRNV